jgi:hypothetical protein
MKKTITFNRDTNYTKVSLQDESNNSVANILRVLHTIQHDFPQMNETTSYINTDGVENIEIVWYTGTLDINGVYPGYKQVIL